MVEMGGKGRREVRGEAESSRSLAGDCFLGIPGKYSQEKGMLPENDRIGVAAESGESSGKQ